MDSRKSGKKLAGVFKAIGKTAIAVILAIGMMPSAAFAGVSQELSSETSLQSVSFPDVAEGAWYFDAVSRVADRGLIVGYGNGLFGPGDTLTRAQAATILWRYYEPEDAAAYVASSTKNSTGMSDVKSGKYYTGAANWAVSKGVISGKKQADGSCLFDPEGAITREQLCTIVANAASAFTGCAIEGGESELSSMPDASSVSSWATASVAWGLANGVISGVSLNGTRYVKPNQTVDRATMAAMLMNAIDNSLLGAAHKPTIDLDAENYLNLDSEGNIESLHVEGTATEASEIEPAEGVTITQGASLQDAAGSWDTGDFTATVQVDDTSLSISFSISIDYRFDCSGSEVNDLYFCPTIRSTMTGSLSKQGEIKLPICVAVVPTKVPMIVLRLNLIAKISASGAVEIYATSENSAWVHYYKNEGWTYGASSNKSTDNDIVAEKKKCIGVELGIYFQPAESTLLSYKLAHAEIDAGIKSTLDDITIRNLSLTCASLNEIPYLEIEAGTDFHLLHNLTFSREYDLSKQYRCAYHVENWEIVDKCTWKDDSGANDSDSEDYAIGSLVYFGSYEQDNDLSNGKEPIEWLVLDVQGGKALLISKYGLDCKPYQQSGSIVAWEKCSLRSWLNNSFYQNAFSADEQARVITTNVDNSSNSGYGVVAGNNTSDRVFCLSMADVKKYVGYSDRVSKATQYAVAQGAVNYGEGGSYWWLRTSISSGGAAYVFNHGSSDSFSYGDTNMSTVAVRPTIWVTL